MVNSTSSNFPDKFVPGEKIGHKTFNQLTETLKSSSVIKPAEGVSGNSFSSGNQISVENRLLRPPIFAKITNITPLVFDVSDFQVPSYWRNQSNCYGCYNEAGAFVTMLPIVYAYSWVEVPENLNSEKLGEQLFQTPNSFVPAAGADISGVGCLKTSPVIQEGLNYGTLRKTPAFHVNNELTYIVPGVIVEMFYGAGDYMLFNSSYYRGDVSPFFESNDYPFLRFNYGKGIPFPGEPKTVNQQKQWGPPSQNQNLFSGRYTDFEQPWLENEDHP